MRSGYDGLDCIRIMLCAKRFCCMPAEVEISVFEERYKS